MKNIFIFFTFLLLIQIHHAHKHPVFSAQSLVGPEVLRPYMFTQPITGALQVMIPFKQHMNLQGKIVSQQYNIQMIKTKQQFLPSALFNSTTIFAYGGQTKNGYKAMFPGPLVMATKDVPIKVTWKNNIKGPHILPVDYNYPFESSPAFKNQVPVVPHAHGIASNSSSDGQPEAYWTSSGFKAPLYKTQQPCANNQAVYIYPNQQEAGNNWFHDHTIGITRLNVYAGLLGFYKITDPNSTSHPKQKYLKQKYGVQVNQNQTKFLIVADKSFKTNGQLFYPTDTTNPEFSSWIPQFYGNVMTVNGVIWPKMNLNKGKHRFVLLNACPNRYLNLYFQNLGKKIPFQLIRIDQDYYDNQIVVTQFFTTISNRIEFILDLTNIQGFVTLKNNSPAPHPDGEQENLIPQFTGQLLKIFIQNNQLSLDQEQLIINDIQTKPILSSKPYPKFEEGQKVFTTLIQIDGEHEQVNAMFIDGVSMKLGMNCTNSTYKIGKTYDFYFINLTPDTHPIHFHLINMQKVKQFQFDVDKYSQKYFQINGGQPDKYGFKSIAKWLDPQQFRTGDDEFPKQYQKIFKDTIDMHPGFVTVLRIKFAKNDGTLWKNINAKGSRFVYHCHMLEHEDNEMMKYFCLQ